MGIGDAILEEVRTEESSARPRQVTGMADPAGSALLILVFFSTLRFFGQSKVKISAGTIDSGVRIV